MPLIRAAITGLALLTSACAMETAMPEVQPQGVEEPAILEVNGRLAGEEILVLPARVSPAEQVEIVLTAYRGGCSDPAGLEVEYVDDAAIDLYPRMTTYEPEPGSACPGSLTSMVHRLFVSFDSEGEKELRVHGLNLGAGRQEIVRKYSLLVDSLPDGNQE